MFGVRERALLQHLEGHVAAQLLVEGAVDHAHPTVAELRVDAVVSERLADHRGLG